MTGGPSIRHLDDFPWQEVRRQQHGERIVSVREKWLDFSPRFLSLYARWDPGMIVRRHTVTTATTSCSCSRAR